MDIQRLKKMIPTEWWSLDLSRPEEGRIGVTPTYRAGMGRTTTLRPRFGSSLDLVKCGEPLQVVHSALKRLSFLEANCDRLATWDLQICSRLEIYLPPELEVPAAISGGPHLLKRPFSIRHPKNLR